MLFNKYFDGIGLHTIKTIIKKHPKGHFQFWPIENHQKNNQQFT